MARNGGKARAMQAGVLKAAYDVILFLDADLTGLDCSMVDTIVMPVLRGERDMFIGICGRRTILTNRLTLLLPKWGGQRALTKVVWSEVPMRYKKHFEIELALNYFALRNHRRTGFTILYKLGQITKEVKRGLLHGAYQRIFMYRDLIWVVIRMYLFESALFILWKVMSASRLTRFINKAFK
jgi:glycosyltransferase involved in cell wall biosynthesis